MPKLTKTYIDHVRPPGKGYALHWDEGVKGYGLRVSAPTQPGAPARKVFIVMGRVGGKSLQFTIGTYGTYTEDKARKRAQAILQDMREGIDPRDVRKVDEAMKVTLGEVMESYVGRPGKLKATTSSEYRRHVEVTFAKWKDRAIVSISEDDVRKRHREIAEHGADGESGAAPASANAAMVTLRILLNYASRQYRRADGSPLIQRNPVGVLKDHWSKLGSRTDRYVDRRTIGAVWNALQEARSNPRSRDALSAIDLTLFAFLTGGRREEMAALTWDRVNIDNDDPTNCWWHLPERKRGDPIWLPLSSQAVALLKQRPRREECPFVFPSWSKGGYIADARTPMELVSAIAGKHLSLHDCRRSFTNYAMRECLIEKFRTDLLTGHKPSQEDVTARNYLDLARLDWLHPEVQKVGDWLEAQGKAAAAKALAANDDQTKRAA